MDIELRGALVASGGGQVMHTSVTGLGKVRTVTEWEWHAIMKELMNTQKWEMYEPRHYVDKQGNECVLVVRDESDDHEWSEVVGVDYYTSDGLVGNRVMRGEG